MNSQLFIEALADIQHDIWSHWMRYLFSVCILNEDGSWTIPADKAERWMRQMGVEYETLPEMEKASDREQAMKVLNAFRELQATNKTIAEATDKQSV